jgi:hypothetical protein
VGGCFIIKQATATDPLKPETDEKTTKTTQEPPGSHGHGCADAAKNDGSKHTLPKKRPGLAQSLAFCCFNPCNPGNCGKNF